MTLYTALASISFVAPCCVFTIIASDPRTHFLDNTI